MGLTNSQKYSFCKVRRMHCYTRPKGRRQVGRFVPTQTHIQKEKDSLRKFVSGELLFSVVVEYKVIC